MPACYLCKAREAGTPGWYHHSAYCCYCQPDPRAADLGVGFKLAARLQSELDRARARGVLPRPDYSYSGAYGTNRSNQATGPATPRHRGEASVGKRLA